jgi:hypothetical protein
MLPGLVRGQGGEIRWAYYTAAGVEGWTLLRDPKTPRGAKPKWSLTARIVGSDKFKMAQRPLLFVAMFGRGRSVWPIEEFRIVNDALTATLGPREDY